MHPEYGMRKTVFKRIRRLPLFPILPLAPILVIGGLYVLQALSLAKLRKLLCAIEPLTAPDVTAA